MWAISEMDITTKVRSIQAAEGDKPVGYRTENVKPNPTLDYALSSASSWNFSQIFGVQRHLTTLTINLSTVGNIFNFENMPSETLAIFSPNFSEYFKFCRYDLVFTLLVQSHFQHQGALVVMVLPWTTPINQSANREAKIGVNNAIGLCTTNDFIAYNHIMTILPHDFITFGHNGNYKVVLPWTCNRSMLPVTPQSAIANSSSDSGALCNYLLNTLRIDVFDQLRAVAGAVSTVNVRILVSLENIQYSGYDPSY